MAATDKNSRLNLFISLFMLIGMTLAIVVTTVLKFGQDQSFNNLLLFAAFGSLMGVISAVCSANGKIITFLFGLLDVAAYGIMCFYNWEHGSSGLGTALLHFIYFVPMQAVGFIQWRKRGNNRDGSVKGRRLTKRQRLFTFGSFLIGTVACYFLLARFDRSAAASFISVAVILDVLPLMCNLIGQLLMSMAYMEQWIFWIGVNIFSIAMWSVSYTTSPDSSFAAVYIVKYCFYLINSMNGLRIWLAISKPEAAKQNQGI